MQRVTLLSVGKVKMPWILEGCTEYIRRLRTEFSLVVFELTPAKITEPDRQRMDESGRILEAARKLGGERWILDETGERMTSAQFAKEMQVARDAGTHITFLLGGAYGFTDAVRAAGRCIRLSDMTLTHEMARLVFLEQLYRAGEINRGSGYHH